MLTFNDPITEIITRRFSCRVYRDEPIEAQKREQLQEFIHALPFGPFGTRPRFRLLAAMESDTKALRGLGTYGFIRNPAAFIVGAMSPSDYGLEDFGYPCMPPIWDWGHVGWAARLQKAGLRKKFSSQKMRPSLQ